MVVNDSLFVGTSDNFECDSEPPITHASSPANWPHGGPVRNAGIVFPSLGSGGKILNKIYCSYEVIYIPT